MLSQFLSFVITFFNRFNASIFLFNSIAINDDQRYWLSGTETVKSLVLAYASQLVYFQTERQLSH